MPTQSDVQAKIEHYGLLRSALRAIEASSPDASAFGLEASFQQIRGWLAELRSLSGGAVSDAAAQTSSAQLVLLDNLDRMLGELQRQIVEEVRSIPLSQLRATLPPIKRQHPEELKALLDVCLMEHGSGSPWWNIVDYLITLLAHEEKNGRRYVARDPTRLTPLLQKLCTASERDKSKFTDALAQMFTKARTEVERGIPAGPIIAQMRSAKHQAMETLLVPELLMAITAYNVAVSNQRAELIETQRVLEGAELETFEKSLGTPVTRAAVVPSPVEREVVRPTRETVMPPQEAVAPFAGSALDCPPLRGIVAAIGCRLRRQDPGEGPESEIAAALDVSKLSAYETNALRDPEPGPVTSVVATAVTVGLLGKSLAALGDRLARAGISAEQLQTEWITELENRIRSEAADLVSEDAYEEARRIAEVRTRMLHEPDGDFNVWRVERDAEESAPASYARPEAATVSPPVEKRRTRVRVGAASWRALAISITCAVALAVGASFYFGDEKNAKVAFFSEQQLEEISPYIESGYRNGRGEGPAFVGTLRAQWETLSAAEREASGRAIEEALLAEGISEFMFFDERRQLMLRYAKGQLAVH